MLKKKEFWTLKLKISKKIFIPRNDTECLIYTAIKLSLPKKSNVLELGTGSGAISLSLAKEKPKWSITGIDLSYKAILNARNNAKRLMINNVNFLKSNWFNKLQKNIFYDLIISNPPYIKIGDYHLSNKNIQYEPYNSLVSSRNGFTDIKIIIRHSRNFLLPNSWLLLEHGFEQGSIVRYLFKKYGFQNIKTICDYGLNERVTKGQWKIFK